MLHARGESERLSIRRLSRDDDEMESRGIDGSLAAALRIPQQETEALNMTNQTGPTARTIVFLLMFLTCLAAGRKSRADILEHLGSMAGRLTNETKPPATLAEWEAGREELRKTYMEIIGLDPLPEKTPLHPTLVGDAVDLDHCTFQ